MSKEKWLTEATRNDTLPLAKARALNVGGLRSAAVGDGERSFTVGQGRGVERGRFAIGGGGRGRLGGGVGGTEGVQGVQVFLVQGATLPVADMILLNLM